MITGAGVISPVGNTVDDFMEGIAAGKCGIGTVRSFDAEDFPSMFGAEVKSPSPGEKTGVDKKVLFLEQAIEELLQNNDTFYTYPAHQRILNLGSGLDYFDLPGFVNSEDARENKWNPYSKNAYRAIRQIAEKYDIQGGCHVNVSACVASNHAIGLSFRMLKQCRERIILTGGTDSMLNPPHYMGFYKLGALSNWSGEPEQACRPFDKRRCGLVLGEGAAVFLLQNYDEADPHRIIAEIVGYSSTMDAYTVTDPHPEGTFLAKAALDAICEAGITPADIDCVHLHGTGTVKNALAEARAMQLIFGGSYTEMPVFSLKGQVGHLIAACGALEMSGVIYALQRQQIPPTINFEEPDADVPLRVITGKPLEMKIEYVLKLNSAFGGQNAAFVIKKY